MADAGQVPRAELVNSRPGVQSNRDGLPASGSKILLCVAKNIKLCYTFLLDGLDGALPEAPQRMAEKSDGVGSMGLGAELEEGRIFYLNRP
jgi:hypothetical protein